MSLLLLFPDLGTPLVRDSFIGVSSVGPDMLDFFADGINIATVASLESTPVAEDTYAVAASIGPDILEFFVGDVKMSTITSA